MLQYIAPLRVIFMFYPQRQVCKICGKMLAKGSSLKSHVNFVHHGVKDEVAVIVCFSRYLNHRLIFYPDPEAPARPAGGGRPRGEAARGARLVLLRGERIPGGKVLVQECGIQEFGRSRTWQARPALSRDELRQHGRHLQGHNSIGKNIMA